MSEVILNLDNISLTDNKAKKALEPLELSIKHKFFNKGFDIVFDIEKLAFVATALIMSDVFYKGNRIKPLTYAINDENILLMEQVLGETYAQDIANTIGQPNRADEVEQFISQNKPNVFCADVFTLGQSPDIYVYDIELTTPSHAKIIYENVDFDFVKRLVAEPKFKGSYFNCINYRLK